VKQSHITPAISISGQATTKEGIGKRSLRFQCLSCIKNADQEALDELISNHPPKLLINYIIAATYNPVPAQRGLAVQAFGKLMAKIAAQDMEDARIIMRRLIWSLNDESGGIGWGAPEAMAEAMANVPQLCQEYIHILISYVQEDGNYLEYAPLRKGAIYGIERIASVIPQCVERHNILKYLESFLNDVDDEVRHSAMATLNHLKQS